MSHAAIYLEAKKLTVVEQTNTLLKDVSFAARAGELHVILGPNGAGKSTLIRAMTGLQAASSGTVLCAGCPIGKLSVSERAVQLAVLLQQQWLDFPFSVQEVVTMGGYPVSHSILDTEASVNTLDHALETFDLLALRDQDYTRLSGGEQQRVHLARLLMQVNSQTRALVLDEPLKAIDLSHQYVVMRQLKRMASQGLAVVVILHDLSLAARFADCVTLLKQGSVIRTGTTQSVMQSPLLSDVFDAEIRKSKDAEAPLFYVAG